MGARFVIRLLREKAEAGRGVGRCGKSKKKGVFDYGTANPTSGHRWLCGAVGWFASY